MSPWQYARIDVHYVQWLANVWLWQSLNDCVFDMLNTLQKLFSIILRAFYECPDLLSLCSFVLFFMPEKKDDWLFIHTHPWPKTRGPWWTEIGHLSYDVTTWEIIISMIVQCKIMTTVFSFYNEEITYF